MSYQARKEYLITILERYKKASRIEKTLILNEFAKVCGYHRKYTFALLNGKRRWPGQKKRPPVEYDEAVVNHIRLLWDTLCRPRT
jgi:hypothetical protein